MIPRLAVIQSIKDPLDKSSAHRTGKRRGGVSNAPGSNALGSCPGFELSFVCEAIVSRFERENAKESGEIAIQRLDLIPITDSFTIGGRCRQAVLAP